MIVCIIPFRLENKPSLHQEQMPNQPSIILFNFGRKKTGEKTLYPTCNMC